MGGETNKQNIFNMLLILNTSFANHIHTPSHFLADFWTTELQNYSWSYQNSLMIQPIFLSKQYTCDQYKWFRVQTSVECGCSGELCFLQWNGRDISSPFFALRFHFKGVVEGIELASNHVGNSSKFVCALFMLIKWGEA